MNSVASFRTKEEVSGFIGGVFGFVEATSAVKAQAKSESFPKRKGELVFGAIASPVVRVTSESSVRRLSGESARATALFSVVQSVQRANQTPEPTPAAGVAHL